MNSRQLVDKIYALLVNRIPGIKERYKSMRYQGRGWGRGAAWLYLAYLNLAYYVFRCRKLAMPEKYPLYETKILYTKDSESSLSKRKIPEDFAGELAAYDVISFDVFDTLIFRPFSSPEDLFFLLGEELKYMDFKRIRMEMEQRAREEKYKKEKTGEVTLDEIYTLLSQETGIDKESAMHRETELEEEYCFANPYMLRVTEELRKLGKRLIVISDMYLNADQIQGILKKCGYGEFSGYYVSCDTGKSKSAGDLYDEVKKREQQFFEKGIPSFVHVGDNAVSDVQNCRKHGFESRHYVNVNAAGEQYRPSDMSVITGSLYRGIVNTWIHNGLNAFSREYEYGFIYGGLFVTGYCQFIHRFIKRNHTQRILFLARDGDILMKAYSILYPEESQKCRYAYWSRLASMKLAAGYFRYDYFRRFIYHKVNQGYSVKKIFGSMELDDMLEDFYRESGFEGNTFLTDKNADQVKAFLSERWIRVMAHYEGQLEAGRKYYSELLDGCRTAVAVDIGWAGSGAVTLDHIVNKIWGLDCEITGIIAGTNTCHNAEPDASETFLQSGKLVSYMYSQKENRDLWKFHDPGKNHNLYWEMLLDAPHGSLKGFYPDGQGGYECRFKESPADTGKILQIQEGILEFVSQYKKFMDKSGLFREISGRDVYAPMLLAESVKNQEFLGGLCGLMDEMDVG